MADTNRDQRIAEAVRAACVAAAQTSYEQAAIDGLCDEGAWEAAFDAVREWKYRCGCDFVRSAVIQLIVFTGLPGTGKSSLAEAVGRELGIPVFAKDWLEATLRRSGFEPTKNIGYAGYELLTTLAQRQLQLGQSVILDSVASIETVRTRWRELAATYQAEVARHRVRMFRRSGASNSIGGS